jgi:prolyl-tRNA synthetase
MGWMLMSSCYSSLFSVEASSGAMGGSKSQEFDLLSPVGEDLLYTCQQ